MTKRIRVENADASDHKVLVQVWDKGGDGEPDRLAQEFRLDRPADMVSEGLYIHASRYIVVKEV